LGFGVANIETNHSPLATVPGLNTKRTPPQVAGLTDIDATKNVALFISSYKD